jgi:hypothetical protein
MDTVVNSGKPSYRTDREWASWALQFAQADLQSWQERDWRNAFHEAMAFAASHDESAHAQLPLTMCGPRTNQTRSLEQVTTSLRSSQKALRRFIRELEQTLHIPLVDAEIPFKGTCLFFMRGGRPEVGYLPREKTIAKQLTIEMLVRLGELFLRGHLSQLRRCPGCHRWFHAVRHQRFDTPKCRMRHRIRLLNGESDAEATFSLLASPSWVTRGEAILRASDDALASRVF